MLKPNSLVGELRFIKIRRLDEGQTEINEKVEANGAESVNHYRGCNCVVSFSDRPHSAGVQMVLDFCYTYQNWWRKSLTGIAGGERRWYRHHPKTRQRE